MEGLGIERGEEGRDLIPSPFSLNFSARLLWLLPKQKF